MRDKPLPTKPARKIKPTRRSVSGMVVLDGNAIVEYESTLERDFVIRQAFDRRVERILHQPITLRYLASNGRRFDYTPDFLVVFKADQSGKCDPPLLVEVKSQKELDDDWVSLRPKFRAAVRYAREQGMRFSIRNENRIYGQFLENIYFLRRFRRMDVSDDETEQLLRALNIIEPTPLRDLAERVPIEAVSAVGASLHLWHLVATRHLECDMYAPLSEKSVVWRGPL